MPVKPTTYNIHETDSIAHDADTTLCLYWEDDELPDLSAATVRVHQRPRHAYPFSHALQYPTTDQEWTDADDEVDVSGMGEGKLSITIQSADLVQWRRWRTLIDVEITADSKTWVAASVIVAYS